MDDDWKPEGARELPADDDWKPEGARALKEAPEPQRLKIGQLSEVTDGGPGDIGAAGTYLAHTARHLGYGMGDKVLAGLSAADDVARRNKSGSVDFNPVHLVRALGSATKHALTPGDHSLSEAYSRDLGFNDKAIDASDKVHPYEKWAGNATGVIGSIVAPGAVLRLARAAGLVAPAAAPLVAPTLRQASTASASVGRVLGGIGAYGNDRSDSAAGTALNVALGVVGGDLMGRAAPYAANWAGAKTAQYFPRAVEPSAEALHKFAATRALKSAGVMLKDMRALQHRGLIDPSLSENQLGEYILKNGLKFGQTEAQVAEHFADEAAREGAKVRAGTARLDELVRAQKHPETGPTLEDMAPARPPAAYGPGRDLSVTNGPRPYSEMMNPKTPPPSIADADFARASPYVQPGQSEADALMQDPKAAKQFFVRPSQLKQRIEDEVINPLRGDPLYDGMTKGLQRRADLVGAMGQRPLQRTLANGEAGPQYQDAISFGDAQRMKGRFDSFLDHQKEQTPEKEVLKRIRQIVNNEIETKASALSEKLDPGLFEGFKAAKQNFGLATTVKDIAEDRALRQTANRYFSPSDHGVGLSSFLAGSAAHGGVSLPSLAMGAAGLVGSKVLRERGASASAVTAEALSHLLTNASARAARVGQPTIPAGAIESTRESMDPYTRALVNALRSPAASPQPQALASKDEL